MYRCESFQNSKEFRRYVLEHTDIEDKGSLSMELTMEAYLNSKPGTWRLISVHNANFSWYFVWTISE